MPTRNHPKNPAQALMETERMAHLYESFFWRRNPLLILLLGTTFNQEYKIVSRALHLTGSETILDLACGPGIYSRRFAGEARQGLVVGMDLSWPMLKQGKQLAHSRGFHNIAWAQGNALALPFASDQFDVVNCAAALHLFDDMAGTFEEVERILKPGGQFTFSTFRFPKNPLIRLVLHLRYNEVGIRSFRQEDIEKELRRAGFDDIRYLHVRGIWVVIHTTKPPR
jgi:ubiquinone/menaquinone biosynthesis C-methylase UbiE